MKAPFSYSNVYLNKSFALVNLIFLKTLFIWVNPGLFLFIFVLFSSQFKYKFKFDMVCSGGRTQGRRMVGADRSTELWWIILKTSIYLVPTSNFVTINFVNLKCVKHLLHSIFLHVCPSPSADVYVCQFTFCVFRVWICIGRASMH